MTTAPLLQTPERSMSSFSSAISPQRRNTVGSPLRLPPKSPTTNTTTSTPALPFSHAATEAPRPVPLRTFVNEATRQSTRLTLPAPALRVGPRRTSASLYQSAPAALHTAAALDGLLFTHTPSAPSRPLSPMSPTLSTVQEDNFGSLSVGLPYFSEAAVSEYWEPSDTESVRDMTVPMFLANLTHQIDVETSRSKPMDADSNTVLPESFNLSLSVAVDENITGIAEDVVHQSSPQFDKSSPKTPEGATANQKSTDGNRRSSAPARQSPPLAPLTSTPIYGSESSPLKHRAIQPESPVRERTFTGRSSILSISLTESARPSLSPSWDTKVEDVNETILDSMPLPPELLAAATIASRSALDSEVQARLSALETTASRAAPSEVQEEIARLAASKRSERRGSMTLSSTTELVARLREQLRDVTGRAQRLWTAAESQASASPPSHPSYGETFVESENHRAELTEVRSEAYLIENAIENANGEAHASQASARELDACNGRLQKELQSARALLEKRRHEASEHSVDACQKLKLAASQLEIEAIRVAEATNTLCSQGEKLQDEAERLRMDRDSAITQLRKQEAEDSAQWNRLAALASLRGSRPPFNTSVVDLAAIIHKDWAEARSQKEQRQIQGEQFLQRIKKMENDLVVARDSANRSLSMRQAMNSEFETVEREKRMFERRASEELASAQAERVMLSEHRHEWDQTRPQLTALIEELRAGRVESTGAARSLSDRLAGLRQVIEAKRLKANRDPASPDRGVNASRGSGVGSDIGSPIAQVSYDRLFSPDSPDSPSKFRSSPNDADDSKDNDDPLLRKAAEENDLLQKKVLELEDEKAALLRSQEELISFIKDRVEPVQRALGLQ